jgi:hypothetical protein
VRRESRPGDPGAAQLAKADPSLSHDRRVESSQISWWAVHEFITAVLDQVNSWPMLGTPAWCSLAQGDPAKWAALLDAAQHHALRLELNQEARAEASRAISRAADWSSVGRELQQLREFRKARPWMRRVAS